MLDMSHPLQETTWPKAWKDEGIRDHSSRLLSVAIALPIRSPSRALEGLLKIIKAAEEAALVKEHKNAKVGQ